MKRETLFFPPWVVADFLQECGKGADTKDYEFLVALIASRFLQSQWGVDCEIGFYIKPKYALLTEGKSGFVNSAVLETLFRKGIDEDTPVDFVIAKNEGGKRKGMSFQVKRFGLGRESNDTDALVGYLNSFHQKYAVTDAILMIIFDGIDIDFIKLKANVKKDNFPFKRIMMVWQARDKVCIGEIFPQDGMNEYVLKDFFK